MCPISHFWQCREKLRVSDFLDYGQFLKAPARVCDKKVGCNGSCVKKEITNEDYPEGCVKYWGCLWAFSAHYDSIEKLQYSIYNLNENWITLEK